MHLNVSKLQKPPLVVQSCKRIAAVEGVTFNLKPCQVLEHDSRAFLPKLVLSYEQISCIFAWCLEIHIYIYVRFGLLAKAMHPLVKRIAARFFNLLEKNSSTAAAWILMHAATGNPRLDTNTQIQKTNKQIVMYKYTNRQIHR